MTRFGQLQYGEQTGAGQGQRQGEVRRLHGVKERDSGGMN